MFSKILYVAITFSADHFMLSELLLTEDELKLYSQKKRKNTQRQFLSSRGFIKKAIAQLLNLPHEALNICFDRKNKCLLASVGKETKAWLSLSHSSTAVAVVISLHPNIKLGIDIEYLKTNRDLKGLAETCLSVDEQAQLRKSSNVTDLFYQYWTTKEAITKATQIPLTDLFKQDNNEVMLKQKLSILSVKNRDFVTSIVFPECYKLRFLEIEY